MGRKVHSTVAVSQLALGAAFASLIIGLPNFCSAAPGINSVAASDSAAAAGPGKESGSKSGSNSGSAPGSAPGSKQGVSAVKTISETQASLKKIAGQIQTLRIDDVLYDRFRSGRLPSVSVAGAQVLKPEIKQDLKQVLKQAPSSAGSAAQPEADYMKEVFSPAHSTSNLLRLLKDSDPKVRTLAMVALFAREDPQVLPAIAELVDDKAKTFPQLMLVSMPYYPGSVPQPTEDVVVGDVAEAIMRAYMNAGGYFYGVKGSGSEPGFAQYWAARKDRKYCAGWFEVALNRASTRCSPTNKMRIPQIKAVRARIDKVPFPDNKWILLYLHSCNGADALVSDSELVSAMKELGPDRLLNMLQYKIDSQDPDLKTRRSNNYPCHEMQLLVLKHAGEVLRPAQSQALLDCANWERDYQKHGVSDPLISPWWGIAAAQLAPGQAASILHGEFDRLDHDFYGYQKAELAYALYRQCGLSQAQFLSDCFYDPQSLWKNGQYSNYRPQWLKSMGECSDAADRKRRIEMLRKIVADKRFQSLSDPSALRALAESLEALSGKKILSAEQKEAAWHPLGLDRFACQQDDARAKYPKESEKLLEVLSDWRGSIAKASY